MTISSLEPFKTFLSKLSLPSSPSIAGSWDVPLLKHPRRPDSVANWCPNSHDFLEIRMAKGYPTKGSFHNEIKGST